MNFKIDYEKTSNKLTLWNLSNEPMNISVSVCDVDSKHNLFSKDMIVQNGTSWWIVPISPYYLEHYNKSQRFRGYEISIYLQDRITILEKHVVWYNENSENKITDVFETNPWNSTWINYMEMFVEDFYSCLDMNIEGVCLDIGANDGLFTEYLLSRGADKVYSIECDPRSVKFLNKKFNHDKRVIVVDKGLWNECLNGVKLAYRELTSTTSSIKKEVKHYEDGNYFFIDTWDFSTLKSKMNLQKINLFKIDIEGAEYEVFESMTDDDLMSIDSFMVEIHWNVNGKIYQITDRLKNLGFKITLIAHLKNNQIVDDEADWKNHELCTFYAKK